MATSTIFKTISINTEEQGKAFMEALGKSSEYEVEIKEVKKPLTNEEAKDFIDKMEAKNNPITNI